jgi:hypothetical protein
MNCFWINLYRFETLYWIHYYRNCCVYYVSSLMKFYETKITQTNSLRWSKKTLTNFVKVFAIKYSRWYVHHSAYRHPLGLAALSSLISINAHSVVKNHSSNRGSFSNATSYFFGSMIPALACLHIQYPGIVTKFSFLLILLQLQQNLLNLHFLVVLKGDSAEIQFEYCCFCRCLLLMQTAFALKSATPPPATIPSSTAELSYVMHRQHGLFLFHFYFRCCNI